MPESLVLAITPTDDLFHVGPASLVLAHSASEEAAAQSVGDPVPGYEYFDAEGARLDVVTDPGTGMRSVAPAGGAPAATEVGRRLLVDRLDVVQARTQAVLSRDLADGVAVGHVRVPRVQGDLPEVLAALAALEEWRAIDDPDPGSWVHNMRHRIFG